MTRSGVTAPAGFSAAGTACGIKADGALDLALLVADAECSAAAVFTRNCAQAAPVAIPKVRKRKPQATR